MGNQNIHSCLVCGKTEKELPLIDIRYNGKTANLCSQCIPVMIHKPEMMAQKLEETK